MFPSQLENSLNKGMFLLKDFQAQSVPVPNFKGIQKIYITIDYGTCIMHNGQWTMVNNGQ